MSKRGPRGDLDRERIKGAADELLIQKGRIESVSLRMIAQHLDIAANAIYTYFKNLAELWHELGDDRLGRLEPQTLARQCAHCALHELMDRAGRLYAEPGTLALMFHAPVLGPHSFRLSETVMELSEQANVSRRDAHDAIMGWFFGSAALNSGGWTSGTDAQLDRVEIREQFPLIAERAQPNTTAQFNALLTGLGIFCRRSSGSPECGAVGG
ncbi:MAG: TetR/AcrR family transcriptional regulator [Micrococcaceae bacterium]